MINNTSKHAYLIMAHSNINQLNLLLKSLDSKYNDIYLHIDSKSSICETDIIKLKMSKLYFFKVISVFWADYSQVECELLLLKEAIHKDYVYYHLLSGMDFLLKSPNKIYEYFLNRTDLYIHYTENDNVILTRSYIKYYHFFQKKLHIVNRNKKISLYKIINKICLKIQQLIHIDRINNKFELKKGCNWFSIPKDFAKYIILNENWIFRNFINTKSPDEFFLQTLAYNSEYRYRIHRFNEDDNYLSCLRLIDWKRGSPYIFKIEDFSQVVKSEFLFLRKVDWNIDKELIIKLADFINEN